MSRSIGRGIAAVAVGVLTVTCTESTAPPVDTRRVATIVVAPDSISMRVGFDLQMTAVLLDSTGDTLADRAVQWTSTDTTLATVTATGLVTAHERGHVIVRARADTAAGEALLTVLTPVGDVSPIPDTATLVPGGELSLSVEVRGFGELLSDRLVTWTSSDTSIVVVDAEGHLTARATGVALVTPASEGVSTDPARVVVALARYVALGSGPEADHTCGIDSQGGVRCWGNNFSGQLGNGTFKWDSGLPQMGSVPSPTGVINQGDFITLSGGGYITCGVVASFPGATTGAASCWGDGGDYRLGNGSIENVPVPSYVRFRGVVASLTAGFEHGCLVAAADSLLYCWGETGQNGGEPWLVSSTLKFATVSGGYHATCGLLADSAAYCAGIFGAGQHSGPFIAVAMGSEHACAIRTDSTAVCWGKNDYGQLGDGTTTTRTAPVPVGGGYRFAALAGGNAFTCGITTTGAVVCWGGNDRGQLGATAGDVCQSVSCRLVPGPVADPPGATLNAQRVVLGTAHACVLNADQRVYCWGWNVAGQLGDGTTVDRSTPVRVVGQP